MSESSNNNLGNLAYYETLYFGLIPCKVTAYDGVSVYFTITADRGPYKRGERLHSHATSVIPRKMVYVRNGAYMIRTFYAWVNAEKVYAIMTDREVQ